MFACLHEYRRKISSTLAKIIAGSMAWSPFPWRCRIVIRCISVGILNYCIAGGLFFLPFSFLFFFTLFQFIFYMIYYPRIYFPFWMWYRLHITAWAGARVTRISVMYSVLASSITAPAAQDRHLFKTIGLKIRSSTYKCTCVHVYECRLTNSAEAQKEWKLVRK